MLGGNGQNPCTLGRQTPSQRFEVGCCWILLLIGLFNENIAILGHAGHIVVPQLLTPLPETEDIAAPIPDVDPLGIQRRRSDPFDALLPDERLAPPRIVLCPGFLLRGRFTHKGLLVYTA